MEASSAVDAEAPAEASAAEAAILEEEEDLAADNPNLSTPAEHTADTDSPDAVAAAQDSGIDS